MKKKINKINRVRGELNLPGDKSISHRAVMFASMAKGKSTISNCLKSDDLYSSINCFRSLGCNINVDDNSIDIEGKGFDGFMKPVSELNCGNSGTTSRLISGILATQKFNTTLVGDKSLSKRPMQRIVNPLREMGANIQTSLDGTLPLAITPSNELHSISYTLPVASAQVKSAVLLAGLHLDEITRVTEPIPTRNHTENMLNLDVKLSGQSRLISVSKENFPVNREYFVPSDISTAAFFIVLTLLLKNSELVLKNILLNDTRTGIITILKSMNADVTVTREEETAGEKFGDILIKSSELKNINIDSKLVPNIIDEIPILSVAGIFAEGAFTITNAEELRVKESNRINSLCENFRKLGLEVDEYKDGFCISGEIKNKDVLIDSYGDHRIAMAFAVLGFVSADLHINNFECVGVSNPDFINQLNSIC